MNKNINLLVCFLVGGCGTAMAAVTAPPTKLDQQEEVKAYFKKTPAQVHEDILKQKIKDQEWLEEQEKQAKRKKISAGQEGKPAAETLPAASMPATGTGTPPPTSSTAPAPKSSDDYYRGY